jgi:type I restriction enzyme R subunit
MKEAPAIKYDPVAVSAESTVVATYDTGVAYQSEAQLEQGFIAAKSTKALHLHQYPVYARHRTGSLTG